MKSLIKVLTETNRYQTVFRNPDPEALSEYDEIGRTNQKF